MKNDGEGRAQTTRERPLWDVQVWGPGWIFDGEGVDFVDWPAGMDDCAITWEGSEYVPEAEAARFAPQFHLVHLAALEALDELYPLPGVDTARLKRDDTGQAYRLVVASAGLAMVAPGSSATDAGAVADRLAERLRDFLKRKGLLERHDREATRGFNSATRSSPVVGRRVEWWLPSEAFLVMREGQWAEVMRGQMTEADALLADFLEELECATDASDLREAGTPEPLWRRWVGKERELPPALLALVRATWLSVKAERAEAAKEAEESKHRRAAIPRGVVLGQLLPAMTGQLQLIDDKVVRNASGRKVGVIVVDGQTTLEVVRSGLALLGSEHGHVLINTLVHRAFDSYEAGEHDARRVAFAGGWSGLAEAIGYGESTYDKLQAIVRGGGAVDFTTPHGTAGGLWTWTATRGHAGQKGEVAFVLGDTLMPGLAAALAGPGAGRTLSAREARRLCPEPRFRPPTHMVRPNERGPVWTLTRLVFLEFVDNAEELSQTGSIAVPLERWRQLFAQARLPWTTHEKVLTAWREGESKAAPALLAEVEPGRFDLAKPHELEAAFLREQGKRRLLGRGGGKDGATKKQAATVADGIPKKRSRKK